MLFAFFCRCCLKKSLVEVWVVIIIIIIIINCEEATTVVPHDKSVTESWISYNGKHCSDMFGFSSARKHHCPRGDDFEQGDGFDRQLHRKQRRRSERLERKRMRIEAHERWVEQCRLAKKQHHQSYEQKDFENKRETSKKTPGRISHVLSGGEKFSGKKATQHRKPQIGKTGGRNPQILSGGEVNQQKIGQHTDKVRKPDAEDNIVPAPLSDGKYIPPSRRQRMAIPKPSDAVEEAARRIINKLTCQNVADMTRETSELFSSGAEGATRATVLRSLSGNINRICLLDAGPLTPVACLPFAGLIRGLQLLHGNTVGAELVESLCVAIQRQLDDNNETAAANGSMLLAHLYLLNAVDSQLAASFVHYLLQTGTGNSVCAAAAGLTFLRACGEKLRKEAPAAMERAYSEVKTRSESSSSANSRYNILLGFIKEIVAGHTRSARRTIDEDKIPLELLLTNIGTLLHSAAGSGPTAPSNKRALLRVMASTNVLTDLTWVRVTCENKPSRWYVPGTWSDTGRDKAEAGEGECAESQDSDEGASSADLSERVSSHGSDESTNKMERIRLMRLQEKAISGQRLNTENKREIFRCIASAADDLEAFTLLMHRDPSFSRLHDTFSVLLQCCYQEKFYNPYYTEVIQRLCSAKTSSKNTLQFALWDMFKAIRVEAADVTGYLNIACLLATLMQDGIYTLGVLRGLDLESTNRTIGLFTRILLMRLIFQLSPARLTEVFFGGNGLYAHDVKVDTTTLRENLAKIIERYFVDENEAGKWIPHFYDVVVVGTPFDARAKKCSDLNSDGSDGPLDEEAQLHSFVRRIRVVFRALKGGIS
uniref:MI domain-containing protein n=1 Tax=Trypanosoma congolense (strain IL3000) TaxID=1068625 RepID=G0UNL3_TRYCI|nr:conserved hypothetical protein [Trypanosoma congolense IL3000]